MLELLAIRGRKAPEDRAVEDAARGTELPELANGTLLRPFRALRPHSPYSQGVALGFIIAAPLGRALLATLGLIIAAPLGRFCWPDRVRGPIARFTLCNRFGEPFAAPFDAGSQKSLRRGCGSSRSTRRGSAWGTRGTWSGPELASLGETLHFLPLLWGQKGFYFGLAGIADFHDFLAPLFHGKGLLQLKLLEFLELFFENRLNLCLLLVGKPVHAGPPI